VQPGRPAGSFTHRQLPKTPLRTQSSLLRRQWQKRSRGLRPRHAAIEGLRRSLCVHAHCTRITEESSVGARTQDIMRMQHDLSFTFLTSNVTSLNNTSSNAAPMHINSHHEGRVTMSAVQIVIDCSSTLLLVQTKYSRSTLFRSAARTGVRRDGRRQHRRVLQAGQARCGPSQEAAA